MIDQRGESGAKVSTTATFPIDGTPELWDPATGATEPFPYDDARAGVPKVGDLEFVVLDKRLT